MSDFLDYNKKLKKLHEKPKRVRKVEMLKFCHDYKGQTKNVLAQDLITGDYFIDYFNRAHEVLSVQHGVKSAQTGPNTVVIELPKCTEDSKNRRLHLKQKEICKVAIDRVML